MAHQNDPNPTPIGAPIVDDTDRVTSIWAEYLRKLSSTSERTDTAGYVKLPGGIILQWGFFGSTNSGSANDVTFPIEFPTACFQVFAGVRNNSGTTTAATGMLGTGTYTTSGFKLWNRSSVTLTANWIAIGH